MSSLASETELSLPLRRAFTRDRRDQKPYDVLSAELQVAFAREGAWLREKSELVERQVMLAQEFEHRLLNGRN